ncbi:MAG: hypothetical protein GY832_31040 [Chloroflexi bacterium]|nr:hypothetical protein [Chloroflexota bacterium]
MAETKIKVSNRNGYIAPQYASWSSYRAILSDPIVSRTVASVMEAVRAHTYRIIVPDNEAAEEWIKEAIDDIYDDIIGKIFQCVLFGFQVAEVYWKADEDEYDRPQLLFVNPDGIQLKIDDQGNYDGCKQGWGYQNAGAVLDADESICWSYGVGSVDITGSGNLHKVLDDVISMTELYEHLVDIAKHHNLPIVFGGIPSSGQGEKTAYNKFLAKMSDQPNNAPMWYFTELTPENEQEMQIEVISPIKGAMTEIQSVADDLRRRIIAGLLGSQKLFFNSSEDGGSYSLTQTQMAEFDRVIKGLWRTFLPGLNLLIERALWRNFRIRDFTLDIEYVDEVSLAAARDLVKQIASWDSVKGIIDTEAVLSVADVPVVPEDERVETPEIDEKVENPTGERAEKAKSASIGKDTKAANKAARVNQMLRRLSDPAEAKVRNSPDKAVAQGLELVKATDALWKQKNGELPETKRDYAKTAAGFVKIYKGKLTESKIYAKMSADGDVPYDKKTQIGNITRNLAKNIGKMATLRWNDLVKAGV